MEQEVFVVDPCLYECERCVKIVAFKAFDSMHGA